MISLLKQNKVAFGLPCFNLFENKKENCNSSVTVVCKTENNQNPL